MPNNNESKKKALEELTDILVKRSSEGSSVVVGSNREEAQKIIECQNEFTKLYDALFRVGIELQIKDFLDPDLKDKLLCCARSFLPETEYGNAPRRSSSEVLVKIQDVPKEYLDLFGKKRFEINNIISKSYINVSLKEFFTIPNVDWLLDADGDNNSDAGSTWSKVEAFLCVTEQDGSKNLRYESLNLHTYCALSKENREWLLQQDNQKFQALFLKDNLRWGPERFLRLLDNDEKSILILSGDNALSIYDKIMDNEQTSERFQKRKKQLKEFFLSNRDKESLLTLELLVSVDDEKFAWLMDHSSAFLKISTEHNFLYQEKKRVSDLLTDERLWLYRSFYELNATVFKTQELGRLSLSDLMHEKMRSYWKNWRHNFYMANFSIVLPSVFLVVSILAVYYGVTLNDTPYLMLGVFGLTILVTIAMMIPSLLSVIYFESLPVTMPFKDRVSKSKKDRLRTTVIAPYLQHALNEVSASFDHKGIVSDIIKNDLAKEKQLECLVLIIQGNRVVLENFLSKLDFKYAHVVSASRKIQSALLVEESSNESKTRPHLKAHLYVELMSLIQSGSSVRKKISNTEVESQIAKLESKLKGVLQVSQYRSALYYLALSDKSLTLDDLLHFVCDKKEHLKKLKKIIKHARSWSLKDGEEFCYWLRESDSSYAGGNWSDNDWELMDQASSSLKEYLFFTREQHAFLRSNHKRLMAMYKEMSFDQKESLPLSDVSSLPGDRYSQALLRAPQDFLAIAKHMGITPKALFEELFSNSDSGEWLLNNAKNVREFLDNLPEGQKFSCQDLYKLPIKYRKQLCQDKKFTIQLFDLISDQVDFVRVNYLTSSEHSLESNFFYQNLADIHEYFIHYGPDGKAIPAVDQLTLHDLFFNDSSDGVGRKKEPSFLLSEKEELISLLRYAVSSGRLIDRGTFLALMHLSFEERMLFSDYYQAGIALTCEQLKSLSDADKEWLFDNRELFTENLKKYYQNNCENKKTPVCDLSLLLGLRSLSQESQDQAFLYLASVADKKEGRPRLIDFVSFLYRVDDSVNRYPVDPNANLRYSFVADGGDSVRYSQEEFFAEKEGNRDFLLANKEAIFSLLKPYEQLAAEVSNQADENQEEDEQNAQEELDRHWDIRKLLREDFDIRAILTYSRDNLKKTTLKEYDVLMQNHLVKDRFLVHKEKLRKLYLDKDFTLCLFDLLALSEHKFQWVLRHSYLFCGKTLFNSLLEEEGDGHGVWDSRSFVLANYRLIMKEFPDVWKGHLPGHDSGTYKNSLSHFKKFVSLLILSATYIAAGVGIPIGIGYYIFGEGGFSLMDKWGGAGALLWMLLIIAMVIAPMALGTLSVTTIERAVGHHDSAGKFMLLGRNKARENEDYASLVQRPDPT